MVRTIPKCKALEILECLESHSWDDKSVLTKGATLQKIACALTNADGGQFAVGIEDRRKESGLDRWRGFRTEEEGNHLHQALVHEISPEVPYEIEWLQIEGMPERGLVALTTVRKSSWVHRTAVGEVWARRGPQNFQLRDEHILDLSLSKGTRSYEDQRLGKYSAADLAREPELLSFLQGYSATTMAAPDFVHKQRLADPDGQASVAGAVLYSEYPSAVIPKKCAVKIARYMTTDASPRREHLAGAPKTIEGPAVKMIECTLSEMNSMLDGFRYPLDAVREIVINAVVHRDYNISDDIRVRAFDNRIEVRSPGALPGPLTTDNLLAERAIRNPTIARLLNKYPGPPNPDIGQGMSTVRARMAEADLSPPQFEATSSTFVVTLAHAA